MSNAAVCLFCNPHLCLAFPAIHSITLFIMSKANNGGATSVTYQLYNPLNKFFSSEYQLCTLALLVLSCPVQP
jgi:hypothetical protein